MYDVEVRELNGYLSFISAPQGLPCLSPLFHIFHFSYLKHL